MQAATSSPPSLLVILALDSRAFSPSPVVPKQPPVAPLSSRFLSLFSQSPSRPNYPPTARLRTLSPLLPRFSSLPVFLHRSRPRSRDREACYPLWITGHKRKNVCIRAAPRGYRLNWARIPGPAYTWHIPYTRSEEYISRLLHACVMNVTQMGRCNNAQ